MSVFDRPPEQLNLTQMKMLRHKMSDAARAIVADRIADIDEEGEVPERAALLKTLDEFFDAVKSRADAREFFSHEERQAHVATLTEALIPFLAEFERRDVDRLDTLLEDEPMSLGESAESLTEELHRIDDQLQDDVSLSDDDKNRLEELWGNVHAQRSMVLNALRYGARPTDRLTLDERVSAVEDIRRHTRTLPSLESQASVVAQEMVQAYERTLIAHKIQTGLEAKYSDEEILNHLSSVVPPEVIIDVAKELKSLRTSQDGDRPKRISSVYAYGRIMSSLVRHDPIRAVGMSAGTVLIGMLAPQMTMRVGSFASSHNPNDLLEGAGFQFASILAQTELSRQLSRFISTGLYGEGGIAGELTKGILGSSPEFFTRNDQSFVRQEVIAAVSGIERTAEITFEGIGSRLARVFALGYASATRIGNPAMFGALVAAVGWNMYVAMKEGGKLSVADSELRAASSEYIARFDEAAQIKVGRGVEREIQSHVADRLEAARNHLADVQARYQRMSQVVMPVLVAANAFMVDNADPDFLTHFVEATGYSTQLTMELTELIKQVTGMQRALRPIVDLVNTVGEFRESGHILPTQWNVAMADVHIGSLVVPQLRISAGDFITVVGESGSGKSTLLKALYGFDPQKGLVEIDGTYASRIDRGEYRKGIMVSNQFYTVETASIHKNIVTEDLPEDAAALDDVVKRGGFDRLSEKHGKTPETLILNKDTQLSGGEKKLLSIAAIDYRLAVAPDSVKMILLDEPTSGVDHRQKQRVFRTIQRWRREHPTITIVVVNHDPDWFDTLPGDTRILGVSSEKILTQDESLSEARAHAGQPFHDVFVAGDSELS